MSDFFRIVFLELPCFVGVVNKHRHFKNQMQKPIVLVSGECVGTCNLICERVYLLRSVVRKNQKSVASQSHRFFHT